MEIQDNDIDSILTVLNDGVPKLNQARKQQFIAGETVVLQGKNADSLWFVRSGLIEHDWSPAWQIAHDPYSTEHGEWAGWSGPGGFFGSEAMSCRDTRLYKSGARAIIPTTLVSIPASLLVGGKSLSELKDEALSKLVRIIVRDQLRRHSKFVAVLRETRDFQQQSVVARMIMELAFACNPDLLPEARVVLLPPGMTQEWLVRAVGRGDSYVSSAIAELSARGIVSWEGLGQPCILDRQRLELIALNGRKRGDAVYRQTVDLARRLLALGANGEVIALSRDVRGGIGHRTAPSGTQTGRKASKDDGWGTAFPNGIELALLECIALARIGAVVEAKAIGEAWGFATTSPELMSSIRSGILNPAAKKDTGTKSKPEQDWNDSLLDHKALLTLERQVQTDARAVMARLAKDAAFTFSDTASPEFAKLIRVARDGYTLASGMQRDPFGEINCLTLSAIIGEPDDRRTENLINRIGGTARSYWDFATLAEAYLLLGRMDEAKAALIEAFNRFGSDVGSQASTRLQFSRLAALPGWGRARGLLELFPVPLTVAYSGHMMAGRLMSSEQQSVAEALLRPQIDAWIVENRPSAAFGALAAGSDILIAEAMLGADVDLHVILPLRFERFIRESVGPGNPESSQGFWESRFNSCLARARSVTFAETRHNAGVSNHNALFREATRLACGHALIQSDEWQGRMKFLAVWDGFEPTNIAGTAMAVADARRCGLSVHTLPCSWRKPPVGRAIAVHEEQLPSVVFVYDSEGRFGSEGTILKEPIRCEGNPKTLVTAALSSKTPFVIVTFDPEEAATIARDLAKGGRISVCHRALGDQINPDWISRVDSTLSSLVAIKGRALATEPFAAIIRTLNPVIPLRSLGPCVMAKAPGRGGGKSVLYGSRRLFRLG